MTAVPPSHERQLLIPLTETEYERCTYDPEGRALLRQPQIWVLQMPKTGHVPEEPLILRLLRSRHLQPGQLLVQSPFDTEVYEFLDEAAERSAERKHLIFVELCRRLGATSVAFKVLESTSETGKTVIEAGVDGKVVKAKASGSTDRAKALSTSLELMDKYQGGDPDLEGAERLLDDVGLTGEPILASLVQARRSGNLLKTRKYVVDLTRESSRSLRAAASLKGISVVNVDLSAQSSAAAKETYKATYEVSFQGAATPR